MKCLYLHRHRVDKDGFIPNDFCQEIQQRAGRHIFGFDVNHQRTASFGHFGKSSIFCNLMILLFDETDRRRPSDPSMLSVWMSSSLISGSEQVSKAVMVLRRSRKLDIKTSVCAMLVTVLLLSALPILSMSFGSHIGKAVNRGSLRSLRREWERIKTNSIGIHCVSSTHSSSMIPSLCTYTKSQRLR